MSVKGWPSGHPFFWFSVLLKGIGLVSSQPQSGLQVELSRILPAQRPLCLELSAMHEHVRQGLKRVCVQAVFSSCM
jgi:hypothetical protein